MKNETASDAAPINPGMIALIVDAVVARLRPLQVPPGWPDGRGCLTEPEASQYLCLGQDFVRQLRQEGRIAHTKIGRRIVYSAENISQFLAACREPRTASGATPYLRLSDGEDRLLADIHPNGSTNPTTVHRKDRK